MSLTKFKNFGEKIEEFDYHNPDEFEHIDGIDVSLTDMRKAVKINVGGSDIELNKDQASEFMSALGNAIKLM